MYKIADNVYIMIVSNYHVFVVDNNYRYYRDMYIKINSIEELGRIYFEKTPKDINLLLRKEKLKKLNNCESICSR